MAILPLPRGLGRDNQITFNSNIVTCRIIMFFFFFHNSQINKGLFLIKLKTFIPNFKEVKKNVEALSLDKKIK